MENIAATSEYMYSQNLRVYLNTQEPQRTKSTFENTSCIIEWRMYNKHPTPECIYIYIAAEEKRERIANIQHTYSLVSSLGDIYSNILVHILT